MTRSINPDYHWTPETMRTFLEALAETGLVGEAAEAAGKSRRAAYNARFRTEGRAFGLGWEAALLVARATLADTLMERAIAGYQVTTVRDPETHTSVSDRVDSKGGHILLARLDRLSGIGGGIEPGSDAALVRIIAQDFWRFLDLVEAGGQGSEAALFVAARTPEPAAPARKNDDESCELPDEDIDLKRKVETPDLAAARLTVWYSDEEQIAVTDFPPPDGFDGFEHHAFGDREYYRSLTDAEENARCRRYYASIAPFRAAAEVARERWLAAANDEGEVQDAA